MKQQQPQQQRAPMFKRGPVPKPVPIFKISNNYYHQLRSKFPAASPRQFNNLAIIEMAAGNKKRNQNQNNNNYYHHQELQDLEKMTESEDTKEANDEEITVTYKDDNTNDHDNDDQEEHEDAGDGIHYWMSNTDPDATLSESVSSSASEVEVLQSPLAASSPESINEDADNDNHYHDDSGSTLGVQFNE